MRRAFTLIELLIVVAIIAILAAIAVPNFLEAQVRSKVSRLMNDMRTAAVAVEAYVVDHHGPPLGYHYLSHVVGIPWTRSQAEGQPWIMLTTPIAYLSSAPADPFALFKHGLPVGQGGMQNAYMFESTFYREHRNRSPSAERAFGAGHHWCVYSWGPGTVLQDFGGGLAVEDVLTLPGYNPNWLYDATNGTKSIGILVRTNQGMARAIQ